ncbi:MAG: HEAT repeat domain-containing protein [Polyangiaceae bacterium]
MLRRSMGLFDFLSKKGSAPPPQNQKQLSKKVAGPAKTVADKRAQTYDRAEAIRVLSEMKTGEAAEALLKRFNFTIDPSITDQEEKEAAFAGIVGCGKDAVPFVVAMCERAEVLTWPLRILKELLSEAAYKKELLALAGSYDTDYARNVEPKLQVVGALGEVKGADAREAIERFLEDSNENVRFTAVQSTFEQSDEKSVGALVKLLETEESIRIKNKVCAGFVSTKWTVPAEAVDRLRKGAMRDVEDFALQADGVVVQRGGYSIMT